MTSTALWRDSSIAMKNTTCIGVLLLALAQGGCGEAKRLPEYELTGPTMGTTYSVKLVSPPDTFSKEALGKEIRDTLDRVEQLASTYRRDSELSIFNANRTTDWVSVSAVLCDVVEQALEVSRRTNGAFDITVGPLVNLWGFGPGGLVTQPPSQADIDAAMAGVGYRHLETRCSAPAMRKDRADLYLDLSGWAKGYAVDQLAESLDTHSMENYLVEIGGELRIRGGNATGDEWAIGIEKPLDDRRLPQSVLKLTNTGVATSGDYRNFFDHDGRRYSHTIDARTGRPVSHALAAVTVISQSAAFADAMATALLVLGPDVGLAFAEDAGVAAYFQVRRDQGIVEVRSSTFDQVVSR